MIMVTFTSNNFYNTDDFISNDYFYNVIIMITFIGK